MGKTVTARIALATEADLPPRAWLIGWVVLLALAGCRTADARGPERLTLVTWNVEWLSADGRGSIHRSAADYRRLAGYAERLKADVIALQEVDGPKAAGRILDPRRWNFWFEKGRSRQRVGIAVRKGISVEARPDVASLDVGGLRAGVHLLVQTSAGPLHVLAVHLKAGCNRGDLGRAGRACGKLRRQMVALEQWIDARAAAGEAFVVLGDFNRRFDGDDAFWAEIDDGVPAGADLEAPTRDKGSTCWDYKYFVDHVVLGERTAAWLVPGSFRQEMYDKPDRKWRRVLSDHCPVTVTLRPR